MGGISHTDMCIRIHIFPEIPFCSAVFQWNKDLMTCKFQGLLDIGLLQYVV